MSFPDLRPQASSITHVQTRGDRPGPHLGSRRFRCRHRATERQRIDAGDADCKAYRSRVSTTMSRRRPDARDRSTAQHGLTGARSTRRIDGRHACRAGSCVTSPRRVVALRASQTGRRRALMRSRHRVGHDGVRVRALVELRIGRDPSRSSCEGVQSHRRSGRGCPGFVSRARLPVPWAR